MLTPDSTVLVLDTANLQSQLQTVTPDIRTWLATNRIELGRLEAEFAIAQLERRGALAFLEKRSIYAV